MCARQGKGQSDARARKTSSSEKGLFPPPDSVLGQQYHYVTLRFWPSLVFILPMLIIFEVGTYLRRDALATPESQLVASYLIEQLFNIFGHSGFYFPGLLVVVVLLTCHLVAHHPWKFDLWILPGMLGESLIWTVPLFVMHKMINSPQMAALAAGAAGSEAWIDGVIRSLGAGIYEEMVFRFMCINLIHLVLVDVFKRERTYSALIAVAGSALIFAASHHPPLGAEAFETTKFLFRATAGLYFAGLYYFRGFGIAVGCHAFYNVILVTLIFVR